MFATKFALSLRSTKAIALASATAVALAGGTVVATDNAPAVADEAPTAAVASNAPAKAEAPKYARTYRFPDGAVLQFPKEWEKGQPLRIHGENFFGADGKTPSVAAFKLDNGGIVRTDGSLDGIKPIQQITVKGLWQVVKADENGNFDAEIDFPTPERTDADQSTWDVGSQHSINILTGSLVKGDVVRGFTFLRKVPIVEPTAGQPTTPSTPAPSEPKEPTTPAPSEPSTPTPDPTEPTEPTEPTKEGSSSDDVAVKVVASLAAVLGISGVLVAIFGFAKNSGLLPPQLRQLIGF